jgi:phosphoribosylformimino-5-aminoimidazole carboxamide ribotide isomerase
MRLIPVIDLRGGLAVHAVSGEREQYRPVKSVLAESANPLAIARAFRERLGLSELYIADLDAIQGHGNHRPLISTLAKQERMRLLIDAGAADLLGVLDIIATGSHRAIIGSETLASWEALRSIVSEIPAEHLIFSLDMRDGQILARSSELAALSPLQALEEVRHIGLQEVILLELTRVGTGTGVNRELIIRARQRFPDLLLLAGGGIRDARDLDELAALGVRGVLVATALHRGIITREHISALTRPSG